MKEKGIFLAAVILLGTAGLTQAIDGLPHGAVDVTYQTRYLWRGFRVYGDKSAIQAAIDVDLYGTGFGIGAMAHRANSSGFEDAERWDYTLYYKNALFAGERYATNYRVGWLYYNFPDQRQKDYDLEELQAVFSWPKICPAGIVPSYALVKLWPSSSGSMVGSRSPMGGTASGWLHIFMLDYGLPLIGLLPDVPEQILNLHAELVFNDGVGPMGQNVDHDWSHVVFGVSTDIDLGRNFALTPAVYYQIRMERSLNGDPSDLWATFGAKYKF
jgi:hypothetical protein